MTEQASLSTHSLSQGPRPPSPAMHIWLPSPPDTAEASPSSSPADPIQGPTTYSQQDWPFGDDGCPDPATCSAPVSCKLWGDAQKGKYGFVLEIYVEIVAQDTSGSLLLSCVFISVWHMYALSTQSLLWSLPGSRLSTGTGPGPHLILAGSQRGGTK